ncbi:MAG: hypothetical protein L3K09_07920, partial [Thermoplasmata archaeon]|nr:hypothetical protein [Thermoplasmata archaeon]
FVRRVGISVPAWDITDLGGRGVAHIEPVADRLRLVGGVVNVGPSGAKSPDLLMGVVVAWYLIALGWVEEELAAATVASLVAIS